MTTGPAEPPDLASMFMWLRQQWWVIAAGMVLGLAVGLGAYTSLPKAYESTTAVLVSPLSGPTGQGGDSLNMDTELQLVQSATVGERAATDLGRPEAGGAVLARLSLFVPPNSTVIEITYEGTTPGSARAGAEAVANAYLAEREDAALGQIEQQTTGLVVQRERLAERATELRTQLADADEGSNLEQQLLVDLDSTLRRVADVDAQIAALEATSVTPGLVITQAAEPNRPSSPDPVLLVASASMLGLLAGVAVGGIRHFTQGLRVRGLGQVEGLDGVEYVVDLRGDEAAGLGRAKAGARSGFDMAMAWRARSAGAAHGLVVVTSASGGHAQGTVVMGLARAAARIHGAGVAVVVDPSSSLLQDASTGFETLDTYVPPETLPPQYLALLSAIAPDGQGVGDGVSAAVANAVAKLSEFHTVVVDAPSLDRSTDVFAFWNCADSVALTVAVDDRSTQVSEAASRLKSAMQAPILALLVDKGARTGRERHRHRDAVIRRKNRRNGIRQTDERRPGSLPLT